MHIDRAEKEQIQLLAKILKVPNLGRYDALLRQNDASLSYEQFLLQLMKQEVQSREANRQKRRLRAATFPFSKTLNEFDSARFEHLDTAYVNELASCDFINRRENIIMIGNPGRGKTHLSIALGMKACQQGFHVKFTTAARLANEMTEAKDSRTLTRLIKALTKADLLILDELSYVSFNRHQSELLFQVISERSERGSIITSTNLEFSKWPELFANEMLLTAMIDRLTFKSHVLNMNGDSSRLSRTKA